MAIFTSARGDYSADIPPRKLFKYFGIIFLIFTIVVAVIYGAIILANLDTNQNNTETNLMIDQFNSLPLADREAIIKWDGYEHDPETFLRPHLEIKAWYYPVPPLSEWDPLSIIVCLLCISSAILFLAYIIVMDFDYWLHDLPRSPYGLLLFCLMFIGWPFFLLSFLIQLIYTAIKHAYRFIVSSASQPSNDAPSSEPAPSPNEATNPKDSDDDDDPPESMIQLRPAITPQLLTDARTSYIDFIVQDTQDTINSQLQDAQDDIASSKDTIAQLDRQLKEKQNDVKAAQVKLGEAIAHLQTLQARPPLSTERITQDATADWQIIQRLPGIYNIVYDSYGDLTIYVRVTVPYQDSYYDFGDFRITFDGADYDCREIRSGQRDDAEDTSACYRTRGDHFCFGNRESEIQDYVNACRYLEALTLIIDCLHWVNEDDRYSIPKCFYQIDPEQDPIISTYLKEE